LVQVPLLQVVASEVVLLLRVSMLEYLREQEVSEVELLNRGELVEVPPVTLRLRQRSSMPCSMEKRFWLNLSLSWLPISPRWQLRVQQTLNLVVRVLDSQLAPPRMQLIRVSLSSQRRDLDRPQLVPRTRTLLPSTLS
jgi:hypothetical protein